MKDFSFMLKTYAGDVAAARILVDSFNAHNVDRLNLDVVVPASEQYLFAGLENDVVSVLAEESIPTRFVSSALDGIRPGYLNQQLVKLAYGRLARARAYMCLDSDGVFLNDFRESDFIAPDGKPYSVLVEDRALKSDDHYYREHWVARESKLKKIATFFGFAPNAVLLTCHGFQIMDSGVLDRLTAEVLNPRGWDFVDLLKIAPYEFSWYNFFLQSLDNPIHVREPYFHVVHTRWQYSQELLSGLVQADWARGYLGLVLNSNFQFTSEPQKYGDHRITSIAMYMTLGELSDLVRTSMAAFLIRLVAIVPVMMRRAVRKIGKFNR